MKNSDFFWRRFMAIWAFAVTALYGLVLSEWVRPSIIKSAFPVDWSGRLPDLGHFFLQVFRLSAGVLVFLSAGYGAGDAAARFLSMPRRSLARNCLLGWFVAGTLLLGFGLTGLYYGGVLVLVLACLAVSGGVLLLRDAVRRRPEIPPSWKRFDVWLPLGAVSWMVLLTCLAPETFQDALRYHLFLPKRFLLEHKFIFCGDFFFWSYLGPFHTLIASALAGGGEIWAKSLNMLCGIMVLAALLRIAGLVGMEESDRAILLALAVTAPGFVLVSGSVFMENEMGLALLLAVEFMLAGGMAPRARLRWIALFLSIAATVKYTAFFGVLGIAAALGLAGGRGRRVPADARSWFLAVVFLSVPILPWAAERFLWTGDPVSPILARLGAGTLDSGSSGALAKAYEFAARNLKAIAESPEVLLAYPFNFAGAHGGFWEHPGPAIPMLLPAAIFAFGGLPAEAAALLMFALGSALGWLVFFGGVSPHYVAGVTGLWTAALVGVHRFLPEFNRSLFRNLLRFCVMYQALICVVMVTVGWGPKGVAMGLLSEAEYLDGGLEIKRVHCAIRKRLEEKYPDRGTVYVYGDDTSYYMEGRVQLDYESGFDPLLWRMAAQSRTPGELRKRVKQRGWTHVLYSTRWPDEFGRMGELEFRQSKRALGLMERFWDAYAVPSMAMKSPAGGKSGNSFVFEIAPAPREGADPGPFAAGIPFIPGAEGLVWYGDEKMRRGEAEEAGRMFSRELAEHRESMLLKFRMAALSAERGDCGLARAFLADLEGRGWRLPALSNLVRSCGK